MGNLQLSILADTGIYFGEALGGLGGRWSGGELRVAVEGSG